MTTKQLITWAENNHVTWVEMQTIRGFKFLAWLFEGDTLPQNIGRGKTKEECLARAHYYMTGRDYEPTE